MRLGLPLLLANYIAFAIFLALRPSQADHPQAKDAVWSRGEFSMSSADPYTYIAARPLYNWSKWHGGEHPVVKIVEVLNLPALFAAVSITPFVGTMIGASRNYGWSWIRAALLMLFATVQWLAIGTLLQPLLRSGDD